MRVVFAGTPATAVLSLQALSRSRHEVVAVVTRPDARSGRGRRSAVSPVKQWADEAGVECLQPARASEPGFVERLRALAPDCGPVVAYGGLLPRTVLDVPARGWCNLHFSLLPRWRGAAPVQHAVMAGDDLTGATTFRLVEALDAGPVYGAYTEPVAADDTAGSLLDRLARAGAQLLVSTLDGIEDGSVVAVDHPADGVTLAPKLTPPDAEVDWARPAFAVDRHVRGCTPDPGAWTTTAGGVRVKLGPLALRPDAAPLVSGEVVAGRREVLVGTATHPVALGTVQPPGRAAMPAPDWARGVRGGPDGFVRA